MSKGFKISEDFQIGRLIRLSTGPIKLWANSIRSPIWVEEGDYLLTTDLIESPSHFNASSTRLVVTFLHLRTQQFVSYYIDHKTEHAGVFFEDISD